MSEATGTQTLEETLNKTDFGHVIYENRKIFLALILAILVGATGYLVWKQTKEASALNTSVQVFEFQSGIWADVKAGKTGIPELATAFDKLDSSVKSAPVMLPIVLEMSQFLVEKGSLAEAELILSQYASTTQNSISAFFVNMQRAVVLEKLGKVSEAITAMEKVAQNKDTLVPGRVYLELGRLYKVNGDKAKAQTQFDYVVNNYPNEAEAKMAKLYLAELAAQ